MKCPKCGAENPEYGYYCGLCASELRRAGQAETGKSDLRRAEPRTKIESILLRNLVRVGENIARRRLGILSRLGGPFRRSGVIVFKSEFEEVSLSIDKEGRPSVKRGIPAKSALVLEGPHESFLAMFRDEHNIDEIPPSIEVRIEDIPFPQDQQAQQIVRDGIGKFLRDIFE